jgi:hypothetical protein
VVYPESTGGSSWRIRLQRLTQAGLTNGAPVDLGTSTSQAPRVAVAADGAGYMACWENGTMVTCVSLAEASTQGTGGFSDTGAVPALTYGAGGWFLAYQAAANGGARTVPLDGAGRPQSTASSLATGTAPLPQVAATTSGYALAVAVPQQYLSLFRFGADGSTHGSEVTVESGWSSLEVGIGASGDNVALVWAGATGAYAVVVDASGHKSAKATLSSAGNGGYGRVSATGGAGSFAASWSSAGGSIFYRALDASGVAQGTPRSAIDVVWDDNPHSIAAVGDGFLVASTEHGSFDAIGIAHLGCP